MRIAVLVHPAREGPDTTATIEGLAPGDRTALGIAAALAEESLSTQAPPTTTEKSDELGKPAPAASPFEVVAVTASPAAAEATLLRALAGGAQRALRVWSSDVLQEDYWAVSRLLVAALTKIECDLILAADRSVNWGSGMTGPAVAHQLKLPHLSGAVRARFRDGKLVVDCLRAGRISSSVVPLPALITVRPDRAGAEISLQNEAAEVDGASLDVLDLAEWYPTTRAKPIARKLQEETASTAEMLADPSTLCERLRELGLLR